MNMKEKKIDQPVTTSPSDRINKLEEFLAQSLFEAIEKSIRPVYQPNDQQSTKS